MRLCIVLFFPKIASLSRLSAGLPMPYRRKAPGSAEKHVGRKQSAERITKEH